MKNILVPTDFSSCAQNAANAALGIAVKFNATIHFLHIMPAPVERVHAMSHTTPQENVETGHAKNELNLLVSKAMQLGIPASPLLVLDKGIEGIENYIEPLNIDLIIMGSHGAAGIREFVIGSQTQRVVKHSTVPVLVFKETKADPFKIENIVFASTFEKDIASAFNIVVNFARLWKATVHILFINFVDKLVDQNTVDGIVKKLTHPYPDITATCNSAEANDEEWGIHQFVEMINADMIALTTRDKTGFMHRHSVAEDLVNHEEIPVLVIGGKN